MKKTALITGASSGIGLEFAKIFSRSGINLVLVARNQTKLDQLANEIKNTFQVDVLVIAKDLSDMNQVTEVYNIIRDKNIAVEYLVNNAGFGDFALFSEADIVKLENMIDLNVKALTRLSRLFVNEMIKRGSGKILNIASVAAFQPGPLMAVYFATKAYVLSLGEAMSNELEGTGVTVTTLCPGPTQTGFEDAANLGSSKLFKNKRIPSAKELAEFGYKEMMKGSMSPVHGFINQLGVFALRLFPRKMVLKVVRAAMSKG